MDNEHRNIIDSIIYGEHSRILNFLQREHQAILTMLFSDLVDNRYLEL